MVPPTLIFAHRTYRSESDGNRKSYYLDVPFASSVKHITLDLLIDRIDDGAKVTVHLVEALTKDLADDDWVQVGSSHVFEKTATGYDVATTDTSFGSMVRVKLSVEEASTPSTEHSAELSIRASGKPY